MEAKINNIFQVLESEKGKPMPLKYKLINNSPLTDNELIYNHNLNLYGTSLKTLPDNFTVNGYLVLAYSKIKQLPNNLIVCGNLSIDHTKINELPEDLLIKGDLYCWITPMANKMKNDPSLFEKYSKQVKGEIYYK